MMCYSAGRLLLMAATLTISRPILAQHHEEPGRHQEAQGQHHEAPGRHHEGHAVLYTDLGDHHHEISTTNPEAQKFFDQGLTLAYGFNHSEAEQSFREAARLDPECAMCYWGIAFVLGPHLNAPMAPEAVPKAWEAIERALELSENATPREQAYIRAMAQRYAAKPPADRSDLDRAFAEAMRDVAEQYPEDLDARTIFAESLMDTMPWDYWLENGEPKPATREVLQTLEDVMEQDSTHPGANHFYIHAVEKVHPERGIGAADRLGSLVPAAGHLVHMPGHIYIRVGRYHDAVLANERAIEADEKYGLRHIHGLYTLGYMPHNPHFLWAAASLAGNSERAIQAAMDVRSMTDTSLMSEPGLEMLQHYYVTPLYALARFGRWNAVLDQPQPDDDLVYPSGVWHYVRGLALARTGRVEEARAELVQLTARLEDRSLDSISATGINSTASLLRIAELTLAGEIDASDGDLEGAIHQLTRAVELEDQLTYEEPPPWYHPVRQILGAYLIDAGRPAEAEAVYRDDLATYQDNGWSLYGLHRALRAQGKDSEADEVMSRFKEAWKYADVTLTRSML